jgi:uncharacterized protein YcfJ
MEESMRKIITAAALAALCAAPLVATATDASASCRGRANTGTAVGAVGGALVGNSISHGGGGAILGGLGGAVLGHQIAKSGCHTTTYSRHAYYHHRDTRHHEARVAYYDRYGHPVYR